ncbi:prolyl 4-hydroxylase subunit alpha-3 [Biomphalaria pfeifferi]|uniref:procollagen-proline 4-dioxygenase n=1 Tax=Biomphalaria pfeifferi TaxID=112525 RepID=A0AAD8FHP4_BIOPF|nr:prolyl 4-hydroxylase subunit alpha-3 [Biomphalaria pfeifferi]
MNKVIRRLVSFMCALTLVQRTSSDVMMSSMKIERMVKNEESLLQQLKTFIDDQLDRIKIMAQFFADRWLEIHMDNSTTQTELDHPNAIFHVIKHFSEKYGTALGNKLDIFLHFAKRPKDIVVSDEEDIFVSDEEDIFVSDEEDIHTASLALIRLQKLYNLSVSDMINGDYLGFKGPFLTSLDAFEIGLHALEDKDINKSLEWLHASLTKQSDGTYSQWKGEEKLDIATVKAIIGHTYLYFGKVEEAESLDNETKMLNTNHSLVLRVKNALRKTETEEDGAELEERSRYYDNYTKLCRLQSQFYEEPPNDVRLVCRYRETLLPYYRFQEELLSISPFVSLIYKFTTDTESEFFKTAVRNKLERGRTFKGKHRGVVSKGRTGHIAWVDNEDSEIANQVAEKITQVTGFNASRIDYSADAYQVVNYGLAGHYYVHLDAKEDIFERIMTFLIYLSDVEMGGATIFPKVGISVSPQKNMALLWYNYSPAHELDILTEHAGCPVLKGQKWILTKWILPGKSNIFRRRCGLKPNSTQLDIEDNMRRKYRT